MELKSALVNFLSIQRAQNFETTGCNLTGSCRLNPYLIDITRENLFTKARKMDYFGRYDSHEHLADLSSPIGLVFFGAYYTIVKWFEVRIYLNCLDDESFIPSNAVLSPLWMG